MQENFQIGVGSSLYEVRRYEDYNKIRTDGMVSTIMICKESSLQALKNCSISKLLHKYSNLNNASDFMLIIKSMWLSTLL